VLWRLLAIAVFAVVVARLGGRSLAHWVDARLNSVPATARPEVSPRARALHARLRVVDLHCDALLWDRSLMARSSRGHVDLPRLAEGHVALQVFSVPTRIPIAANYRRTPNVADAMTALAIAQRWPLRTWFDPFARARYQAEKLSQSVAGSHGGLTLVTTRAGLDSLAARLPADGSIGAVLLLEGLHPIGRDLARVDTLFADGFRVFGIAHMFDNDVGGSAHGWRRPGLSPFGRRVVARIDSLGGVVDLAHASPATIDDVLALTTRPVLVSHTGVQATCPGPRNLSDDQVTRIAAHGGLIAIGFWDAAVCGRDARAIARAIRHCAAVAGIEHVAIGSDFDGAVRTPFDASGLALVTDALLQEGFSEPDIARVMGMNAERFFRDTLPPR
jgi:membrane dipeptidase